MGLRSAGTGPGAQQVGMNPDSDLEGALAALAHGPSARRGELDWSDLPHSGTGTVTLEEYNAGLRPETARERELRKRTKRGN